MKKLVQLCAILLVCTFPALAQTQHDRIHGRGASTFDQYSNTQTLVVSGATPSVAGGNVFRTSNSGSTTITNFIGGVDSQQIVLVCGDTNTIVQNNANIAITGGTNFSCTLNNSIAFVFNSSSNVWSEIGGTGGGGGGGSPGAPAQSLQCNSGSGTFIACKALDTGTALQINEDTKLAGPNPYTDVSAWGQYSNASPPSTTASCINGSPNITLTSALDFQDASKFPASNIGNGIVIYQCGAVTGLSTPQAPTVTPVGVINGSTTYTYNVASEDLQGGLTAASPAGTTTVGATTLGVNTITLTQGVWTNTSNGTITFTCSGNCNVSSKQPVFVSGFVNSPSFNGNYTINTTPSGTTFTVYNPTVPTATTDASGGTVKIAACNILTMPAGEVPNIIEGASSDQVMRHWIYRNGILVAVAQYRDFYYEDCGVNTPSFPPYIPTTPGAAVNKYLATTIVSGGGTTSIVVANNAGNTTSGQTALHDNSQNLLAALHAQRFNTPVYMNGANTPFNAATVFSTVGNTRLILPVSISLNQPWVIKTSNVNIEGGIGPSCTSFTFGCQIQVLGSGTGSYPVIEVISNTSGSSSYTNEQGIGFTLANLFINANATNRIALSIDGNGSFGVQLLNVSYNTGGASFQNMPAARITGVTHISIVGNGREWSCAVPQAILVAPCMRFTDQSTAVLSGSAGTVAHGTMSDGNFQGNGFQVDCIPNQTACLSGGFSRIEKMLGEQRFGPFLRLNTNVAFTFRLKNVDDDAPNSATGFIDNGSVSFGGGGGDVFSGEDVGGSVFMPFVVGPGRISIKNSAFPPGGINTILFPEAGNTTEQGGGVLVTGGGTGIQAGGINAMGYAFSTPAAPTVVLGGSGSCVSNCVATGTHFFSIFAIDSLNRYSARGTASAAQTVDGTQTVTLSWTPLNGQTTTGICSGTTVGNMACNTTLGTAGVSGTNFVVLGNTVFTVSAPQVSIGNSESIGSNGFAGHQSIYVDPTTEFTSTLKPTALTGNRVVQTEDANGFVPVVGEQFFSSPRGPLHALFPGALTTTWIGETFTLDKAITVTRVQAQAKTAPNGCSTNAIIRLTDGTSPVNLTISSSANDSGAISQNYAAGAVLTLSVQTAASGCTTSPGDANAVVQYRMQ